MLRVRTSARPPVSLVVMAEGDPRLVEACLASVRRSIRRDDRCVVVDRLDADAPVDPYCFAPFPIVASLDEALGRCAHDLVLLMDRPGVIDVAWLDEQALSHPRPGVADVAAPEIVVSTRPTVETGAPALRWARAMAEEGCDPAAAAGPMARALISEGQPKSALSWLVELRRRQGEPLAELLPVLARANLGELEVITTTGGAAGTVAGAGIGAELADALCTRIAEAGASVDDVVFPSSWPALAELAVVSGTSVAPVLGAIPTDRLRVVLARMQFASPEALDAVAEALHEVRPADPLTLAFAGWIAPRLAPVRALEWSGRLRAVGQVEQCPLLAVALDDDRAGLDRARAAVLAIAAFDDESAAGALPDAVASIPDDDLSALIVETHVIAPELLDHVLTAAATTSERCVTVAACLHAHGATEGAVAVLAHGSTLGDIGPSVRARFDDRGRTEISEVARAAGLTDLAEAMGVAA